MKEFQVHDLTIEEGDRHVVTIQARNAEEAGHAVLGYKVSRHPGTRRPVIAKAYSQGDGGLTMVRLYRDEDRE